MSPYRRKDPSRYWVTRAPVLYSAIMKRIATLLFASVFFGLFFFHSTEAHALGPVNIEAGALAGYATNPNSDS
ncbi:MAG: hypothetical protein ABI421_15395, partial [Polyangiaceae bacterium]